MQSLGTASAGRAKGALCCTKIVCLSAPLSTRAAHWLAWAAMPLALARPKQLGILALPS